MRTAVRFCALALEIDQLTRFAYACRLSILEVHLAKNQNTVEKRRREMEKRQRAEDKRKRRQKNKELADRPGIIAPPLNAEPPDGE
jgi:hypothetical protein